MFGKESDSFVSKFFFLPKIIIVVVSEEILIDPKSVTRFGKLV